MVQKLVFVNRRRGRDRRFSESAHNDPAQAIYERRRSHQNERRDLSRSLSDDYYAYMQKMFDQSLVESQAQYLKRECDKE